MSVIHGLSHKAIRLFRDEFGALAVYWIYISRANGDRVAWPSLNGLARDTGMNKATVLKARRWLVARCAIERVKKYVPPKWRELPDDERGALLQSHARTEFYRITGYVKDEAGVSVDMLYFPGDVQSDIEEIGIDGLPDRPSTPYTVHGVDLPRGKPELGSNSYLGSSNELGESGKRPLKPSKKKKEPDYTQHDALINAWATAMGYDGAAIGATYTTKSRRAAAAEMLEWEKPPTPDEIARLAKWKAESRNDYEFAWVANDLPKFRRENPVRQPVGQVIPLDTAPTASPVPDDVAAAMAAIVAAHRNKVSDFYHEDEDNGNQTSAA